MQRVTRSQHTKKRSASRKATQSTGSDKLVKKRARHEPDRKNRAVFDPEARTHQYHASVLCSPAQLTGRPPQVAKHDELPAGSPEDDKKEADHANHNRLINCSVRPAQVEKKRPAQVTW